MILKRAFDLFFSIFGLVTLFPLFACIAAWIKLDSPGPVFFRQIRVGQHGKHFGIFKFRTMVIDAEAQGLQITTGNDPRVTKSGKFLRHYKLDEIPQLINVFMGDMSFVGPRPEVPRYVALYPPSIHERLFSVRPGITDLASIQFKDENKLLEIAADVEKTYIEEIMPVKLKLNEQYISNRSFITDVQIILRTLKAVFFG